MCMCEPVADWQCNLLARHVIQTFLWLFPLVFDLGTLYNAVLCKLMIVVEQVLNEEVQRYVTKCNFFLSEGAENVFAVNLLLWFKLFWCGYKFNNLKPFTE